MADATTVNWENYICINSDVDKKFDYLGPAVEHLSTDSRVADWEGLDYQKALVNDSLPLPLTEDREGYYGPDHFSYWASGLLDARMLMETASKCGVSRGVYLDIGCASGRVTRHTALQYPGIVTLGCDINRLHVEWCNRFLPQSVVTFQNSSVPGLPLASASVDLISAFSVFTHIEALETNWLMEIKRVLRPGGIAWITLHTEQTLQDMAPDWPLWKPVVEHPDARSRIDMDNRTFDGDRLVLRWHADKSYSANVFYKKEYIQSSWGRMFDILEFKRRHPGYQDVVVLQKR